MTSTPDAPASTPDSPAPSPDAPASSGRGRAILKWLVVLVLALVWIRFVLFAWLFPIIERRFDSPEITPADEAAQVESLAPILAGLVGGTA